MASAICSDYTPVKTRRGTVVHALAWTKLLPECGKARPRAGYVITELPLNCTACMARMVALIRRRARKATATRGAARP